MEILKYTGKLAEIVALVRDAGEPPDVRAVFVTREEMDTIINDHSFRTTVSKYYGDSSTMVYNSITADTEGNIISLYLNHILIALAPEDPTGPIAELTYPPLTTNPSAATTFANGGDLLVGTGNPATGMMVGTNANIELALAVRKAQDLTNYNSGTGRFVIPVEENENWNFVVSVGSMNADVPNITDMYNVKLFLDLNSYEGQTTNLVFELKFVEGYINGNPVKNYVWYKGVEPVVVDGTTNEDLTVTQMIQKYSFQFISKYIPSYVQRNEAGAPLGNFTLRLEATPKHGGSEPVSVEVLATITKKK
jgi:hypothetical protein